MMKPRPGSTDSLRRDVEASWHRFLDLYEPLRPELYRYCRHLTRSPWDADDLAQDVLFRAFAKLGGMNEPPPNPRLWLFRVASNLWIDRLRAARASTDLPRESVSSCEPRDVREAAGTLLSRLSPQESGSLWKRDGDPMLTIAAIGLIASGAGMPVKTGYAPVNGLEMYYEIHGRSKTNQVPLVLLHGGGSTIETSFAKLLPLLSKERRVIAFEQQGHGHTADVDRPFSFEQSAEDAVALLRHLKIEKADWFGYSNGGHIALQVAISHPEVVHRLILESIMYSRGGADPQFWQSFEHAKLDEMPAELKQAYRATAPHPEELPVFFEKSVQRMRSFKGWTREQIQSVKQPVLLLVGDRDIVRVEHAAQMQRLLHDARLAVLPGTDHLQIVQRAEWVAELVEEFFAQAASR